MVWGNPWVVLGWYFPYAHSRNKVVLVLCVSEKLKSMYPNVIKYVIFILGYQLLHWNKDRDLFMAFRWCDIWRKSWRCHASTKIRTDQFYSIINKKWRIMKLKNRNYCNTYLSYWETIHNFYQAINIYCQIHSWWIVL